VKSVRKLFFGTEITMHWLRGEYCSLDGDVAALYEVERKKLITLLRLKKYSEIDCFPLNVNEHNRVSGTALNRLGKNDTIYALNEAGIIRLSFDITKSRAAAKISVKVVRETSEVFKLMAYVNKADRLNVPLGPQYDKVRKEIDRAPDIVKLLLGMTAGDDEQK